jgi:predicted dehydrogenase
MSHYNAAIVGCGRIGSEFDEDPMMRKNYGIASHAGAYMNHPEIKLVAAADISAEKRQKFSLRWGVNRVYADYSEMLRNENIDILSICTPNFTHYDIFEKAIERGVRAIFCEKPISDSLENADKMVKIIQENDVTFLVNHRRRWDHLYLDLRKLIGEGGLGDIHQVSCYYNGGIANTGCHIFDVLRMLFGEARFVTAWRKDSHEKDDPNMDGYLVFENDVTVSMQSLDIQNYMIFEFDIYGAKRRFRIKQNGFEVGFWEAIASYRYDGLNELVLQDSPIVLQDPAMFKNAIQNIVDSLKGNAKSNCSGEDGVKALEMISAFHLSALTDKTVSLPLKERTYYVKSK